MKKLLQLAAAGIAALTLLAPAAHAEDKPRVEMKTSLGTMVIELDPAAAPIGRTRYRRHAWKMWAGAVKVGGAADVDVASGGGRLSHAE